VHAPRSATAWEVEGKLATLRRFTTSSAAVLPYFQIIGGAITVTTLIFVHDWRWWALSVGVYFLTCCLGLSVTYHRLLTHRSFEMAKWMEYVFSWLGAMGATGSTLGWVALHHQHHAHADGPGDPHSPRLHGWRILFAKLEFDFDKWSVRALAKDRFHRVLHCYYHAFLALWALLLCAIDPMVLLFCGIVPATLQLNISSLSNYLNHRWGYRNFHTKDDSTNNALIALLAWGEGWHNNHHRFPRRWSLRVRWWELDPGAWVVRAVRRYPAS
jgi:stearoyl-CoA desaturase (delta-9 desaturase)